jgi:hypothetical protein
MVKVSIQVRKGAARFDVAFRARNPARAVSLVEGWYPGGDYRARFSTGYPQSLFAEDLVTREEVQRCR